MSERGNEPASVEQGGAVYRITVLMLMALLVGVIVSLAAIAFVELVAWLNTTLLISPRARVQVEAAAWVVPLATVAVPTLGGLVVGVMLSRLSDEKRGLGPPDVIGAVQLRRQLPGARAGIVSTAAAAVSLGVGASVGQYGPMVYLGALIASVIRYTRLRVKNLEAISIACGVAAAIATAFNAPIAGLVFAHEVILRHYSLQAFAPVTVASETGYVVANVMFERPALFLVDFSGVQHGYEFALFALLGSLAAGVAVAFMLLTLKCGQLAGQTKLPPAFRPAAAGCAVGIVALWLPDVLGIGKETLRFATIEGAFQSWELVFLVAAKIGLTALCIGFGFAGGVFSPALLIGILFGALFWTVLNGMTGIENSGIAVYAICGMMALTSPVIGAPLTTILIVFELTRNYDLTIAAMVAVVFSNLIAYRTFGRSLFDVQLGRKGVDLSAGRDQARLMSEVIGSRALQDYPCCQAGETVRTVIGRLAKSQWGEAMVTDEAGVYLGVLRLQDVIDQPAAAARDVMQTGHVTFETQTTIWEAMAALKGFVGDAVPVVDPASGKLVGTVTETMIIETYLDVVHDLRREENAAA
ncbi:MAG: chloride channel protein [Alphaproteobacteria bacterium]|nr:chloride channel protein [Alphaproteobacteria bacterium]